jgi:hypothetical protein
MSYFAQGSAAAAVPMDALGDILPIHHLAVNVYIFFDKKIA